MLDVVARQLEDVRRDVLKDCHDVEGHLEHQHLDKDTLKIVIMRSHQDIIVKLRSRSRSGEGQVRVRKVRVRSESCELKDFNINLRTWT